ncbi:hypothetical protein ACHAXN_010355 [Cyclotella atomus]
MIASKAAAKSIQIQTGALFSLVQFGYFNFNLHRQRGIVPLATKTTSCAATSSLLISRSTSSFAYAKYLIYWRGEHKEGYSESFRQWEFLGALSATIATIHRVDATETYHILERRVSFVNAFAFDPTKRSGLDLRQAVLQAGIYNTALQYMSLHDSIELRSILTPEVMAIATKRCALIHTLYQVLSVGMSYSELIDQSLKSRAFGDTIRSNQTNNRSWALYRHEYSFVNDYNSPRFGKNKTRSESKERAAILALAPLVKDFGGNVNLKNPDCPIYLLEGLRDDISVDNEELYKILCIKLSSGAKQSIMAPSSRICKTTTPLCSIAAHIVCNIAMIRDDEAVLDPFAGSAATLLAASLIAPEAQTVGIEVVSDALLSRENIRRDFSTRGLKPPLAVIEGDVMDATVRNEARKLIGDKAFDVIVTDPPWGRREAASKMLAVDSALSSLIDVIKYNRLAGNPILKKGGRLVIFQPCHKGQRIEELLPSDAQLQSAGLQLQDMKEQRLNDGLSRWVLSFLSV